MGAQALLFTDMSIGGLSPHSGPVDSAISDLPKSEVPTFSDWGSNTRTASDVDLDAWARLVTGIQSGDPGGLEELYQKLSGGIRLALRRQLGTQDVDDHLHDVFLLVAEAIREGGLRDSRGLMAFVRTIARRVTASSISRKVQVRNTQVGEECIVLLASSGESPEGVASARQQAAVVRDVLAELSCRDREVLRRFYIDEQDPEQICDEMGLTPTQFRLLKNRAKARFSELGQRRTRRNCLSNILMRISRA